MFTHRLLLLFFLLYIVNSEAARNILALRDGSYQIEGKYDCRNSINLVRVKMHYVQYMSGSLPVNGFVCKLKFFALYVYQR